MSGYGLEKKYHLSNVLKQKLDKNGFNFEVINASVAGDTSAGGLNRIKWILSEKNIKIVVLCLGANDMLRGIKPDETMKNLEKIINITLNKKILIILAGMVAPSNYEKNFKNKFDRLYF